MNKHYIKLLLRNVVRCEFPVVWWLDKQLSTIDNYTQQIDAKHSWKLERLLKDINIPLFFIYSSSEPTAQVIFSDRLSSVVCSSVCKLFIFSSSESLKPLVQFQQNLAQTILKWMEFKIVQTKCHGIFQGDIITK